MTGEDTLRVKNGIRQIRDGIISIRAGLDEVRQAISPTFGDTFRMLDFTVNTMNHTVQLVWHANEHLKSWFKIS